jgi:ADP-ribosylglycohydrolase
MCLCPGNDSSRAVAIKVATTGADLREEEALDAIVRRWHEWFLTGVPDARIGLRHIDADRRDLWGSRLGVAKASQPSDFTNNGPVVEALQAAWSAIKTTPVSQDDPATGIFCVDHLRLALDAAVGGGGDTDTVAAIAGGLIGAASACR